MTLDLWTRYAPGVSDGKSPFELEPEQPDKTPDLTKGNGKLVPEPAPPPPVRPPPRSEDGEVDTRTVAERKGEAPPRATENLGNPPDWPQEALSFPMRPPGPAFLAFVMVPFFLMDLMGYADAVRFFAWVLKLLFLVFVLRAQFAVIGSSAAGHDAPVHWKNALQFDKEDFWRYVWTMALVIGLHVPGIVFWFMENYFVAILLLVLGSMYASVVAMGEGLKDSSLRLPWRAFPWIKRGPFHCVVGCVAWWALLAVEPALVGLSEQSFGLVAFVALALRAVCAYLLLVSARALGVLARAWQPG